MGRLHGMGLFSRYTHVDAEKVIKAHGDWLALADGEEIEFASRTARDMIIFTDRRVVITDTQGWTGKKKQYQSIPYRSVARWSVESKGHGWKDGADLKLWVGSQPDPLVDVELRKDASARDVATLLSLHAMG